MNTVLHGTTAGGLSKPQCSDTFVAGLRVRSAPTIPTGIALQVAFTRLFTPNSDLWLSREHTHQTQMDFRAASLTTLACFVLPFPHILPHHVFSLWQDPSWALLLENPLESMRDCI